MSRREALVSAVGVFVVAVVVRLWAASVLTFPQPEDSAYYVDVARNLVAGHGLTADAIWSFQTPPLSFPRPAFEVWLPLPTWLAAIPMAIVGATFAAAQVSSTLVGAGVAVLAWRLGADVAAERELPAGRARTLALGAGLTTGVYLPMVLASAEPDSTTTFAALTLAACLLMVRVRRRLAFALLSVAAERTGLALLVALGIVLGLAALTRNDAIWLALTWAILAWPVAWGLASGAGSQIGLWARLVGIPAVVAIALFAPWAVRDWLTFGNPLPAQALTNALYLKGSDIFAWQDMPTISRYLDAGRAVLLGIRIDALIHNLGSVLLLLGVPVSAIGLSALPWTARGPTLRPLLLFGVVAFMVATLVFPVATTWGTFLHEAGAIHVLLIISALLVLDALIDRVVRRQEWTRPVAWLGPALTVAAALLFSVALLPGEGDAGRTIAARYAALPAALAAAGTPLPDDGRPVITDFPIWLADVTGHRAIALPDETPDSILDLAAHFGNASGPAPLLVVQADNGGLWPEVLNEGAPDASCFTLVPLSGPPDNPDVLSDTLAFRITCTASGERLTSRH